MSIWKGRTPRIANKIVEKNKARELPLVDFNIYYKITENETDHCGTKQDQWNRTDSPETDSHKHINVSLITEQKSLCGERILFSTNGAGPLDIYRQNTSNLDNIVHILQKLTQNGSQI